MRVIDLSTLSMAGGSGIVESKIPLWWADGMDLGAGTTSASPYHPQDGTTSMTTGTTGATQIFTLSSTWSLNEQYAFEASIYSSSGYTSYSNLYDITSSSSISLSQISTTSTSEIVVRSSKFTLTPGHIYTVGLWSSSSSGVAYMSDASLIVFPQ